MKKLFLSLILAFVSIVCANAQLLYKISHKDLEKTSYIVGTYHLAPASFIDSISGANAALAAVDVVCGEVVMSEMESRDSQKKVKQAMMLPDGKSLTDVFTTDEMQRINDYMDSLLGMNLNNPILKSQMGKMTPMALSTQLQLVQYMKVTPNFNPLKLIDAHFQKAAKKAGKQVAGLETVDFQIEALYKSTTIERQKQQLLCMVDNAEYHALQMKELSVAFFTQDIQALWEVTEEKMGNQCDSTPKEEEILIYGRNAAWVEKMPAMMENASTLFVVGAAHLPGDKGVLELLKARGYTVEAVK
ncbi:MAG: TraB/GumN family protein [Bacteroidaceae bacterium]|nr:TraB/GumN family protein [Bacteroidaceae bacterium]